MSPNEVLKQYFGYDEFRPGQKEIVEAILSGRDCLAVMPTGAGKSICYQVPALMLSGITIVISPLISLMQDQVKALNEAGIHAAYINSSLSEHQISLALQYAAAGRYKIIYAAPERLETVMFQRFALSSEISMVTVDEAHCISQWGQDFRPSYVKITDFIRKLPVRPIVSAFTATATKEVKEDILCTLSLENPKVTVTGFDRPNLFFEVETPRKKDDFVLNYVKNHPEESGIIYCATRKNTDNLFELLFRAGVSVSRYHAGMTNEERKASQENFVYDRTPVMVATNAFGMGIDKSNVRFVIHYNMPQSMENYYQEAGRAGRDGGEARCTLLFSAQDVRIDRMLLEQKDFSTVNPEDVETIQERDLQRLRRMETYCRTSGCLRNYILSYFGEKPEGSCENCGNCLKNCREEDRTEEAKKILACVTQTGGRYGMQIITGILLGAKRARLAEIGAERFASFGALENANEVFLKQIVYQMIEEGYLYQTEDLYAVLKPGPNAGQLRNSLANLVIKVTEEKQKTTEGKGKKERSTDQLTSSGFTLFEKLRSLRSDIARESGVPPYIVFTDKTLIDMCVKHPRTKEEMLRVSGVASVKYERYGERFLKVLRSANKDSTGV